MDIVVTQIKQIGREIMLDGNSLVGYQHSANLFIKLIKDTSETNPFKGMVLSGYCTSWKSDMPMYPTKSKLQFLHRKNIGKEKY